MTDYTKDSLFFNNKELDCAGKILFSDYNLNLLGDALRYSIYKKTGDIVEKPQTPEIANLLKDIYTSYDGNNFKLALPIEKAKHINTEFLARYSKIMLSNLLSYKKYLHKLDNVNGYISNPQATNIKNEKAFNLNYHNI